ncbi:hypothetical protein [Anaerotignum sp.]|uniref:hypothetical protein n=1 Tax=Anaerotignum sp. TaxID=2039241 RepID=UPI00271450FE|nr:hypothetical protein [Anaerotignum sp.]
MKQRSKNFVVFMIAMMLSFSPVCAFADEINNPAPFSITSGLGFNEDDQDVTFDDSRMVYGETAPFAGISVTVCRMDSEGVMFEDYNDTLEVGSLGIFSTVLPLELGTNYIEITVNGEDYEEETYCYEVKRKPQAVKEELKSMIALPGLMPKYE